MGNVICEILESIWWGLRGAILLAVVAFCVVVVGYTGYLLASVLGFIGQVILGYPTGLHSGIIRTPMTIGVAVGCILGVVCVLAGIGFGMRSIDRRWLVSESDEPAQ